MKLVICVALLATLIPSALSAVGVWSYYGSTGPESWKSIAGSYCNGTQQSPINIVTNDLINDDLGFFQLVGYESENNMLDLVNGGHGITVPLGAPNLYNLSGGSLPNTYTAIQFHFHWGSVLSQGSEHTVNGMAYPAEMHMVHYDSSRFDDLTAALTSGSYDAVAALGFFIEVADETNTAFDTILDHVRNVTNYGESLGAGNLPSFSLRALMPFDLSKFYRYNGSLTIPNCYEAIIWTVFEETIKISQAQLDIFRSIYGDHTDSSGNYTLTSNNFRTVNPLYGREVIYSSPGSNVINDDTTESMTTGGAVRSVLPMGALFITLCSFLVSLAML